MEKVQHNLSYEAALSTLRVIDQYTAADFDTLGITAQDFNLAHGNQPWRRDHINRVMKTLQALLFGTLEVQGIPKIVVPAEYVAAVVTAFVAPANRMLACVWLSHERQTGAGALDLSSRGTTTSQIDPTTPEQLFALVVALSDADEATSARQQFKKRLGKAIDDAALEAGVS